jgi:hypothetical protein
MAFETFRIISGAYEGYSLSYKEGDDNVYVKPNNEAGFKQHWFVLGSQDQFFLITDDNRYLTFGGGNQGPLRLDRNAAGGNYSLFSWGSQEGWGARALQCFADSGQNVDAGVGEPNKGPLTTRGWRHGNQKELTWNQVPS